MDRVPGLEVRVLGNDSGQEMIMARKEQHNLMESLRRLDKAVSRVASNYTD